MQEAIRTAEISDFEAISELDKIAIGNAHDRSGEIADAIEESRCTLVASKSGIEGFAIATPNAFRGMDFLNLVVVHPSNRRQGIATLLINHFASNATSLESWTSTNQSNQAMITLLQKLGWHQSDHVEELDPGDPELFYYIN